MLKDPKKYTKLKKDPAAELSLSVLISLFELQQLTGDSYYDIAKGERLYFAGLKELYPVKALSSDANFTMLLGMIIIRPRSGFSKRKTPKVTNSGFSLKSST